MLFSKLLKPFWYLLRKTLKVLGDFKVYRFPLWAVYKPHENQLTQDSFKAVLEQSRSFDVMLTRDSSFLDAGFIPKFWNHAAIYVNDREQTPWEGKVIHFMSEGMVEWTLYRLCKTDEVCILRPKFQFDPKVVRDRIEAARGKGYDFGFNFENFNRLSCSEFITYLFQGYDHGIKSEISFGKVVIPPTNIVDGNFELIFTSKK